jgi:hypothetical protein
VIIFRHWYSGDDTVVRVAIKEGKHELRTIGGFSLPTEYWEEFMNSMCKCNDSDNCHFEKVNKQLGL